MILLRGFVVYFAANSYRGLADTSTTAINVVTNAPPSVPSNRWIWHNENEASWGTVSGMSTWLSNAAAMGMTVFAIYGDWGSNNNLNDNRSCVGGMQYISVCNPCMAWFLLAYDRYAGGLDQILILHTSEFSMMKL
jgi:hypothetical protein